MLSLSRPILYACFVLNMSAIGLAQSPNKDNAPIPNQIFDAKKVFISNAAADANVITTLRRMGQPGLPYDRFYSEMKAWGRYELVSTPADADLVFEIRFSAPITDFNGQLTSYAPQYDLSIVDVKTHFTLWSLAAPVQEAFRKATLAKNLDEGMAALMSDLKKLAIQPAS